MKSASDVFKEIDLLFHPRAIASVGVSHKTGNMGMDFLVAIKEQGYTGKIYAIHPNKKIPGIDTYPALTDVPGPVDHVLVCVPARLVPGVIEDCVKKGVRSVVIFSSGFGEWGTEEGLLLEKEVARIAGKSSIRLIGPNCMGLYCPDSGLSFRSDLPVIKGGKIGMISQSGGVAQTPVFTGGEKGIGFSKSISYGNEIDLGAAEWLVYLGEDPATEVIFLYIEGTRDGTALLHSLKAVAGKKPVLVVKGGKTGAGGRAVQSHTGAMAGAGIIWETLCRQTGALLVDDCNEMLDTAMALTMTQKPRGRNAVLMSVSGGFGVMFTDLLEDAGFHVPELREPVRNDLRKCIGNPGTSIRNPLDMAGSFWEVHNFPNIFKLLNDEDDIDIFIIVLAMEYLALAKDSDTVVRLSNYVVDGLIKGLEMVNKTVMVVFSETYMSHHRLELEKQIISSGYPVYPTLQRCTRALNNVIAINKID